MAAALRSCQFHNPSRWVLARGCVSPNCARGDTIVTSSANKDRCRKGPFAISPNSVSPLGCSGQRPRNEHTGCGACRPVMLEGIAGIRKKTRGSCKCWRLRKMQPQQCRSAEKHMECVGWARRADAVQRDMGDRLARCAPCTISRAGRCRHQPMVASSYAHILLGGTFCGV